MTDQQDLAKLRIEREPEPERESHGRWITVVVVAAVVLGALVAWLLSRPGRAQVRTAVARAVDERPGKNIVS